MCLGFRILRRCTFALLLLCISLGSSTLLLRKLFTLKSRWIVPLWLVIFAATAPTQKATVGRAGCISGLPRCCLYQRPVNVLGVTNMCTRMNRVP